MVSLRLNCEKKSLVPEERCPQMVMNDDRRKRISKAVIKNVEQFVTML